VYSVHKTLIFGSLLLMQSCKSDVKPIPIVQKSEFIGEWKMAEAYKDEVPTKLLDNAYFRFTQDGKVVTNLLGNAVPVKFDYSNGVIAMGNGINCKVVYKTTDTLIMITKLRDIDFEFITVKDELEND